MPAAAAMTPGGSSVAKFSYVRIDTQQPIPTRPRFENIGSDVIARYHTSR